MTARTPTYLKAHFENGDIPVGTDYEDVFDSYLNIAQATSSEQQVFGPLKVPDLTATRVSAVAGFFTSLQAAEFGIQTVSATNINAVNLTATNGTFVSASTSNFSATLVSASTLNAVTVTAGTLYVASAQFLGASDVSAVGSTQASGFLLDAPISFVTYADSGNISVRLPTSIRGKTQTVVNASTTTIRIFPAVSARFLVTAFNASLNIPADRVATVYHKGDDRYGIQIA